ncbi:glutamate 5-kinase [Novosphingobium sp. TCA1]|uniref:glutamate 5-kinase n=1 Tax=Novosphingobium sp. TCA1 TaxID=2682474 RepID=UPI0013095EDD|nr:glutamate 5-kinase [Novosphingobium sp. TCA1]GFE73618.1 glutamate 5-kinase 1 [Novosphingobium sp. TCA1]
MPVSRLSDLSDRALAPRLVVKVGSALLVGKQGVRREWLTALVAEIAEARARGQDVIVVSSGAIALGAATLGLDKGGRGSLADAQAAAAVGQIALSGLWAELLGSHGLTAAQMLLTLDDLEDRRRYLNVTATLTRLLDAGAVPVINENDSVATQEIRFGDNDRLAARVAQAAQASAVLLLSDIDGLYDRHPKEPGARMIPVVEGVTPEVHAMASAESNSGMGSGGMVSKLQAAEIAELAGICLVIGNGQHDRPVERIMAQGIGTLFLPRRRAGARKAWLGGRLRLKGSIHVDAGAAAALLRGSSLLAKGVTGVEGHFERGDPVAIVDAGARVVAHGLSEYHAGECDAIRGLHSSEQAEVLGYSPRSSVVHRDQLVLK